MKRAFIYTIFLLTAGVFFTELKAQEVYLGEVKIIQKSFRAAGRQRLYRNEHEFERFTCT